MNKLSANISSCKINSFQDFCKTDWYIKTNNSKLKPNTILPLSTGSAFKKTAVLWIRINMMQIRIGNNGSGSW